MDTGAWAIGLFDYQGLALKPGDMRAFHDLILSAFRECGIAPTYIGADGAGVSDKLTKWAGKTHKRIEQVDFAGIHNLSVVANPPGSDDPRYDTFASASFWFIKESGETLLCLMMEDRLLAFGSEQFDRLLMSLVSLRTWEFGLAFPSTVKKRPDFHVMGADPGTLTKQDWDRLCVWYASPPAERRQKLRELYPYLLLNREQLSFRISDQLSLEDFIGNQEGSILAPVEGQPLWLWKIPGEKVESMRMELLASGVLISK